MRQNKSGIFHRLTRNWGLKIASFIFAVALWLVVVNVNDPTIRYSWDNVPVTIKNADVITDQGMIYEVLDGTDTVSRVTISAPKSVIQSIDKSDIVAVADMNNLNSLNAITIDYSVSRYGSKITNIKGSIDSVKVNIENKKSIQLVLQSSVTGSAPSGYMVGNVTTDQNLIRVSGPESLVDQIKSARVDVDMSTLTEFTSDITTSAQVHLYDAEDNEVAGDALDKRPESVMITIEILSIKEVPLTFETDTQPAPGYGLTGAITREPQTVQIAGKKNVISNISQVVVPAEALDVTGATEDVLLQVNVKQYLPDNTILADKAFDGIVQVLVGVEREVTNVYEMEAENVTLLNAPESLETSLEGLEDDYTVSVTGIRTMMNTISARNLQAYFDVQNWMANQEMTEILPGRYDVELQFTIPEHTRLEEPVKAVLVVTEETESEEE